MYKKCQNGVRAARETHDLNMECFIRPLRQTTTYMDIYARIKYINPVKANLCKNSSSGKVLHKFSEIKIAVFLCRLKKK